MSWDAELLDSHNTPIGEWNYTHNCNGMANDVLIFGYEQTSVFDEVFAPTQPSWWTRLNGLTGVEGAILLTRIIAGLEADPDRYRAMEVDLCRGWGSYDEFVRILREMRDAVPEADCRWECYG